MTFEEFLRAVRAQRARQRKAAAAAAQIHIPYLAARHDKVMKHAMRMVHQWRGKWSATHEDALVRSGIMPIFSNWIRDLWQPAPADGLAVGVFVSVGSVIGMKGRVIKDRRPALPQVEIEE